MEKVLDRYEGIKMSYAAAQRNLRNIEIAKWVQKKGDKAKPEQKPEYNTKSKQSSALRDFAKSLFQQWDRGGFGKLKIIELTRHFIQLGLAANEEIALSFFKNLIQNEGNNISADQILQQEIQVDTFLSLFKVKDTYSENILKVLNAHVKEKRSIHEKKVRDIELYRQLKQTLKRKSVKIEKPQQTSRSSASSAARSSASSENWHHSHF